MRRVALLAVAFGAAIQGCSGVHRYTSFVPYTAQPLELTPIESREGTARPPPASLSITAGTDSLLALGPPLIPLFPVGLFRKSPNPLGISVVYELKLPTTAVLDLSSAGVRTQSTQVRSPSVVNVYGAIASKPVPGASRHPSDLPRVHLPTGDCNVVVQYDINLDSPALEVIPGVLTVGPTTYVSSPLSFRRHSEVTYIPFFIGY